MTNTEFNPILHEQIHEIVERQIRENEPKETKETLDRLMRLGYSRHEAVHKIGAVVVEDIFDVLSSKEKFNKKRFINKLQRLK